MLSEAHAFAAKAGLALLAYGNSMLVIEELFLAAAETHVFPHAQRVHLRQSGVVALGAFSHFWSCCWLAEVGFSCGVFVGGGNIEVSVAAGDASVVAFGALSSQNLVVFWQVDGFVQVEAVETEQIFAHV
jgi:hypothetical protein